MSLPAKSLSHRPERSHLRLVPPAPGVTRRIGPSAIHRRLGAALGVCLWPVAALIAMYHAVKGVWRRG